ncbi:hypothetical protein Ancab_034435, partial [Ancistrocladus abbreviatus]
QDKMECSKTECDQRVQRVLREKAEHREKAEGSRCAGEQAFQTKDGSSRDTPLRFLFQRQKKLKKHSLHKKSISLQTLDRAGMEYKDANVGPTPIGPTKHRRGNCFNTGGTGPVHS